MKGVDKMRKVLIACFLSILMLMVPITAVSRTANLNDTKNIIDEEKVISSQNSEIRFYITNSDYNQIVGYIENYIPDDRQVEAYDIVDYIITPHAVYGYEVDMEKLGEKWIEYGFHSIDPDLIDNADTLEVLETLLRAEWVFDILGEFVNFITGITPIKNRLGWFRRVLNDMYSFCKEGAYIVLDVTVNTLQQLKALANVVNFIISVPETLYLALDDLVNNNGPGFKNKIGGLLQDFIEVTVGLIPYAVGLLSAFQRIANFLGLVLDFILDMLAETPWNDNIYVSGTIIKNFPGEVTITCRGQSTTAGQGSFGFNINPNPDGTSLPENEFYGIHDCTITVEQDGTVLKSSTKILSYVFSDGTIYWPFVIIRGRPRTTDISNNIIQRFNSFIETLQIFFPNIFKHINRIIVI